MNLYLIGTIYYSCRENVVFFQSFALSGVSPFFSSARFCLISLLFSKRTLSCDCILSFFRSRTSSTLFRSSSCLSNKEYSVKEQKCSRYQHIFWKHYNFHVNLDRLLQFRQTDHLQCLPYFHLHFPSYLVVDLLENKQDTDYKYCLGQITV